MAEERLDRTGAVNGAAYSQSYSASEHAESTVIGGDDVADDAREFSLKSFKCFARQHPLLVGFGAAGIGATMATFGAGYMLYRGARRSLPMRVLRLAKGAVTF